MLAEHEIASERYSSRRTLKAALAKPLERRLLEGALRPVQAVMLTQGLARIGGAEQAAPLQDRDHLRAEDVQHRRQQRRHDVEAVRRAVGEPVLDQIGNLLRRASKGEMAAGAGEVGEQLPQR